LTLRQIKDAGARAAHDCDMPNTARRIEMGWLADDAPV